MYGRSLPLSTSRVSPKPSRHIFFLTPPPLPRSKVYEYPRKFDENIIRKLLQLEEKVRDIEAGLAEQSETWSNTWLRQQKEKAVSKRQPKKHYEA